MGIRKDLKEYIKRLNDKNYTWLYADGVVKNLEEILREDKERKTKRKKKAERNEYIAVKQSELNDDGDTFEAIKDGYGIPPMGCKFVKVRK
jgi:hypothetical protein